ncbi:unnamed protein product, partial [Prunus armeniaca]
MWESTSESHFSLPSQLAPSPIRPRRFFYIPHSAMLTEDSHDTQHHTPPRGYLPKETFSKCQSLGRGQAPPRQCRQD